MSGRKEEQLVYRKHTMFPGGLKERNYKDLIIEKPDDVRGFCILICFRSSS